MGVSSRLLTPFAALCIAFAISACGEDDFANEPRAPSPIALTAVITDTAITVSPSRAGAVGAGLAAFTISNQSTAPGALVLEGPTDVASAEILPGNTGELKTELAEGDYVVSSGEDSNVRESTLEVGSERASAQNELLLP